MGVVYLPGVKGRHLDQTLKLSPRENKARPVAETIKSPPGYRINRSSQPLILFTVLVGHLLLVLLLVHLNRDSRSTPEPILQVKMVREVPPTPDTLPEPNIQPKPLPISAVAIPLLPAIEVQAKESVVDEVPKSASPVQSNATSAPGFDADYLSNPAPKYPSLSWKLHEQGQVTLRVHVTAEGTPDNVLLAQTSRFPRLDQAAIEVVWRWRFTPAQQNGKSVDGWVIVPIQFALKS